MVKQSAAVLVAISLLMTGWAARAAVSDLEFYTGDDLATQCSATPAEPDFQSRLAQCAGYVMGVSDAVQADQGAGRRAPTVCIQAGTRVSLLVMLVQRFLEAHPEKARIAAQDLVVEALSASYPCR